jgi:hypothetical protein
VRNGFQAIRVTFEVKGDAPSEKLRRSCGQGRALRRLRHLTNGVPVSIAVEA